MITGTSYPGNLRTAGPHNNQPPSDNQVGAARTIREMPADKPREKETPPDVG
jgi:hypothetical protein